MEYLRALGRAAGKEDVALRWVTPSGLLVQQMYPNTQDKRIRLRYLSDVRLDVRCKVDDLGLDQQRMARGLSPNVVHSQDASHMALVTNHAMSHGVRNLGGIHDCFVTTPAEMKQVRNSVRTTFADLYAASSFDTIVDQLLSQLSSKSKAKLPPRPVLGGLDLSQVQTSSYFIT
jgi:DNA-directed RNA polymerase